jgi:hypothetical protein
MARRRVFRTRVTCPGVKTVRSGKVRPRCRKRLTVRPVSLLWSVYGTSQVIFIVVRIGILTGARQSLAIWVPEAITDPRLRQNVLGVARIVFYLLAQCFDI